MLSPKIEKLQNELSNKRSMSDNFDMECRILWADESIHWISAKGRVYRNPKGDPVRMMGTVLDITEQQARRGGAAEKRTRVSGVGRVHAADRLGHQQPMGGTSTSISNGWTTPVSPWKKATAKAGSLLSTPTTGSARGMPGSVRHNIVTPIRLNAVCGALMASYQWWLIRGAAAAQRERRDSQMVWHVHRHRTDQTHRSKNSRNAERILWDAIIENIPPDVVSINGSSQSLRYRAVQSRGRRSLVGSGRGDRRSSGKTDYDFWSRAQAEFFVEQDRETLNGGNEIARRSRKNQ